MAFQRHEAGQAQSDVKRLQGYVVKVRLGLDDLSSHQDKMTAGMRVAYVSAVNARRALDQALTALDRDLGYIINPESRPKMKPPPGMEDAVVNPLGDPNA